MEDLIKRGDAIKAMEQRYEDILRIFKRKVKVGEKAIVLDMIGCVKNLPSADRPSGEWIDVDGNFVPLNNHGITTDSCRCSECGEWLVASDEYPTIGKFCPNCGAYMRGEHDD